MRQDEKLQRWIEQGTVQMSQLFFRKYKQLQIEDVEAMFIMQLVAFQTEGQPFPTPQDFADRMHMSANDVTLIVQKLMQYGFLQIKKSQDVLGVYYETYSLMPLWLRLAEAEVQKVEREEEQVAEGELFKMFEQEFGRFLSPMEVETISKWLDEDEHTPIIIQAALREAVIAQKVSLRYIDRILFEWKKKNVQSLQDVERQTQKFRSAAPVAPSPRGGQTETRANTNGVKRVPFYNWLEERE